MSNARNRLQALSDGKGDENFVAHPGPAIKKGPKLAARDARVDDSSILDFADFIRSTGPDGQKALPRIPGSVKSPANNKMASTSTTAGPVPGGSPRAGNMTKATAGPRLKAREPTNRSNTNDLVDALRQGPPGAYRVASGNLPIRNARDQDDSDDFGYGTTRGTNSMNSTQDSFVANSVNSRTGLISPAERPMRRADDSDGPVRKSRRPRDPYAIDSDEDEDEDEVITPRTNEGESLMDFLSTPPPAGARLTPPPLDVSGAMNARKRNDNSLQGPGRKQSTGTKLTKSPPPGHRSSNAGQGSGSIASALAPLRDQYSGASTVTGASTRARVPKSGVARTENRIRLRDDDIAGLRDMADFLKNSGPPEPPSPPKRQNTGEPKKQGGFGRMFSKKKREVA